MPGEAQERRRRGEAPDPAARARFDELFDELFPLALGVARRIVLDPTSAEDIAAETMARAYRHWGELTDLSHQQAWVARVATNLALDLLRRRPPPLVEAHELRVDDAAATRLTLAAALQALPKRQREVLVLRYLADLPERAVAVELGIAPGTVKVHLRRAVDGLRAALDPPGTDLAL